MPTTAWIGEPTDFKIFNAHKGSGQFSIRTIGRSGHSSRPDQGVNAIAAMGDVLRLIEGLNEELSARVPQDARDLFLEFPEESFNSAVIRGGQYHHIIPDVCELEVCYRCLPETPS